MRAGGIDAFAAPVGEAERGGRHAAEFAVAADSLNSVNSQDGKSPPTMSPSRECLAQRAISAASSAERGLPAPSLRRTLPAY